MIALLTKITVPCKLCESCSDSRTTTHLPKSHALVRQLANLRPLAEVKSEADQTVFLQELLRSAKALEG